MAVDSVISSTSTQANVARQASGGQQAQAAQRQEARAEERTEREQEAPRPVVNAQGQTTGTLINVTA